MAAFLPHEETSHARWLQSGLGSPGSSHMLSDSYTLHLLEPKFYSFSCFNKPIPLTVHCTLFHQSVLDYGCMTHAFNTSTQRQEQEDLSEFKTSLDIVSSRTAGAKFREPV